MAQVDPEIARSMALLPVLDFAHPAAVRVKMDRFIKLLSASGLRPMHDPNVEVEDCRTTCGVPLRIYTPRQGRTPRPVIVYFHGGAFVLGDLDFEHPRCLEMARETGAVVVAVDYRLAPEHPFPAPFDDCWATFTWVSQNEELEIDRGQVAVAGASAGGALAAAVCLMARDRGIRGPRFQLLLYPVIDDRMITPSMAEFVNIPGWNRTSSEHMWSHYLGKERGQVLPYAAPARAHGLRGLPPAYIMTADQDALRDEGIEYARRLIEDGVPAELHHYPCTFHGFDTMANGEVSRRARAESYAALRKALDSGPARG
jgi:acetyl esterase